MLFLLRILRMPGNGEEPDEAPRRSDGGSCVRDGAPRRRREGLEEERLEASVGTVNLGI